MSTRRLISEPLLHFVVLGAGLFGLYQLVEPAQRQTIEVDAETVETIHDRLARRLGEEPSAAALDAELDAWIEAEMLYREALALGLDRDDPIVRRRMVQRASWPTTRV